MYQDVYKSAYESDTDFSTKLTVTRLILNQFSWKLFHNIKKLDVILATWWNWINSQGKFKLSGKDNWPFWACKPVKFPSTNLLFSCFMHTYPQKYYNKNNVWQNNHTKVNSGVIVGIIPQAVLPPLYI